MPRTSATVGVEIYVLRRAPTHDTEVLLLRDSGAVDEAWHPVTAVLEAQEREADAATRAVYEAIAVEPQRLYAAAFSDDNDDPDDGPVGRIGVWVAFVDPKPRLEVEEEETDSRWSPLATADAKIASGAARRRAARVRQDFVRQAPDESLRVY